MAKPCLGGPPVSDPAVSLYSQRTGGSAWGSKPTSPRGCVPLVPNTRHSRCCGDAALGARGSPRARTEPPQSSPDVSCPPFPQMGSSSAVGPDPSSGSVLSAHPDPAGPPLGGWHQAEGTLARPATKCGQLPPDTRSLGGCLLPERALPTRRRPRRPGEEAWTVGQGR